MSRNSNNRGLYLHVRREGDGTVSCRWNIYRRKTPWEWSRLRWSGLLRSMPLARSFRWAGGEHSEGRRKHGV